MPDRPKPLKGQEKVNVIRLKNTPDDQNNNRHKKHQYGDLVDPMHHFDIDITGTIRVFLSEEIAEYRP